MAGTEILQAIREHVQTTDSGTVTVVFEDDSIGRVYLDDGKPALAKYRGQEGLAALEACKGLAVKTAKFHAGVNIVGSKMSLDSSPVPQSPAPAPPPVQQASSPSLTPDQRRVIGRILAEHVGPASALIMSELPDEIGLDAALNLLVGEIGDAQLIKRFVMQVRRALE